MYLNFLSSLHIICLFNILNNSIVYAVDADADLLQNVFVLWRHGDRAPYGNNIFPNKSSTELWPYGLGQLSDIGINQHYNLGLYLRSLYREFIPEKYHYKYYHIRSSDYDRTLMSAQSNLAGFFKNTPTPLQEYNLTWRPIPVHTVQKGKEILFSHAECPYHDYLSNKVQHDADAKKYMEGFKPVLDTISNNLGFTPTNEQLWSISDELECLKAHKVKLPSWMDTKVQKGLYDFSLYFWKKRFSGVESLSMSAGLFLYKMLLHMNDLMAKGSVDVPIDGRPHTLAPNHVMAFSAHDTNVAPVMAAFGVDQNSLPGYTATVLMELHGPKPPHPKEAYKFRLLYKNSPEAHEAVPIKLPYCDKEMCDYTTVEKYLQTYAVDKQGWEKLCHKQDSGPSRVVPIVVLCLVVVIMLGMIIGGLVHLVRKRHGNVNYQRINT